MFARIWKGMINLLVKGTVHSRMKVMHEKTTVIISATFDVGCFKFLLKKKDKKY